MNTINFWPILVAAVVAFVIGALWYSPLLFGKEWMALTNVTEADVAAARTKGGMWKSYLAQFISTLVLYAVMGFLVAATNLVTLADGAFLGFLLWLGFSATELVGDFLWEKKPFKLVLIQGVGSLVTLVVGGAIIGGWV